MNILNFPPKLPNFVMELPNFVTEFQKFYTSSKFSAIFDRFHTQQKLHRMIPLKLSPSEMKTPKTFLSFSNSKKSDPTLLRLSCFSRKF